MSTDFFFIRYTSNNNNNNNNPELALKKVNHWDFVQKPVETITYRGFLLLGCFCRQQKQAQQQTKIGMLQTPAAHQSVSLPQPYFLGSCHHEPPTVS